MYSQYFVPSEPVSMLLKCPQRGRVSFSPSVTRTQDICQVISIGSFWPAHSTTNLKRNLHTKLLIMVFYFGNILFIINTFPGLSSANSQLSPHLQTPGTGADSEGAGAEDRGSVLCLTVAKSSHSLTLNCFSNFSKSLNKDQSWSSQHNGSSAAHFLIPQYKNSQERKGNGSFLNTICLDSLKTI